MDQSQKIALTQFNFFEWKDEMEILLREKGLYRLNMETDSDPNAAAKNLNGTKRGMRPMVFCV